MSTNLAQSYSEMEVSKSEGRKNDFVDFIVEASNNPILGKQFVLMLANAKSSDEVGTWLKNNGHGISESEIERLFAQKDNFKDFKATIMKGSY
jgi:hypothetical protein